MAEIAAAATAGDLVRLETAATAAITGAAARVNIVGRVAGSDAAPLTIEVPISQVRAVRLGGSTTGLTVAVSSSNAGGPQGAPGPAGPGGVGNPWGPGTLGGLHVTVAMSPYEATGPLYFTTLVVDAGAVLDLSAPLAGLLLGTVSADIAGTLRINGGNGQPGAAGGAGGVGGGYGAQAANGNDGSTEGGDSPTGYQFGGGQGGNGGAGTVPGGTTSTEGPANVPRDLCGALAMASTPSFVAAGIPGAGGSGDGTYSGGGGGGIGGMGWLGAPTVTLRSTAVLQSRGGNGGIGDPAGTTGGGGGGPGGIWTVIATTLINDGVTVDVAGGLGGTGPGGGSHNGQPGTAGSALNVVPA
jgi:hypothetical protein